MVWRCRIAAASELVFCPEDWHFYLFLGEDMLLCTLNCPSLSLNPVSSVPPQVYLYLCLSLSKPKNVHAISKPPPSLLRDCPPPHTVHLAFLLAPFFFIAFSSILFYSSLLSAAVAQHCTEVQPAVTAKCSSEGGKVFLFFFNPHTFSFILHFSPCTHAQLASPLPSPLCCFPLSLLLLFIPVSLSPSLSFFGLFSSSFLSFLSPSFSLA